MQQNSKEDLSLQKKEPQTHIEIKQEMMNIFEIYKETKLITNETEESMKNYTNIIIEKMSDYVYNKVADVYDKLLKEIIKLKDHLKIKDDETKQPKNEEQTKKEIKPTLNSLQAAILPMLRMDELRKFNPTKRLAKKIFDSDETMKMIEKKRDLTKTYSIQLKIDFFNKIRNQPDLLYINITEDGHIFGCYCKKPCRRPDYWVEDENHKLFSFNGKSGDHLNNRKLEIIQWKKECQSFKSFYFKSSEDYLYANMGILVQSIYDKEYSQIHQWLGNNFYDCESNIFVGHNNLFKVMKTMVVQLQ